MLEVSAGPRRRVRWHGRVFDGAAPRIVAMYRDIATMPAMSAPVALGLVLAVVIPWQLVRAYRLDDGIVERWARDHGVELTDETRPLVRHYLPRAPAADVGRRRGRDAALARRARGDRPGAGARLRDGRGERAARLREHLRRLPPGSALRRGLARAPRPGGAAAGRPRAARARAL